MSNNGTKGQEMDSHWHLDKRVPLSIIFAMIVQIIYFTMFFTKLDSRVALLEANSIETRKTIQDMAEIKIHQQYLREKFEKLDDFLRDDVEWVKPKHKQGQ